VLTRSSRSAPDPARTAVAAGPVARAGVPLLAVFLAVVAGGLALGLAQRTPEATHGGLPALGLLIVLFALCESTQVHFEVRRQTASLSLSEAPLVVALFLVGPLVLLPARLVGSALVFLVRHTAPVKAAFNLASIGAETAVAATVYLALYTPSFDREPPAAWLAACLAVLAADAVAAASVFAAISWSQGRLGAQELGWIIPAMLVSSVMNTTMGLLVVVTLQVEPRAAILLLVLAGLLGAGYRAYDELVRRHATLGQVFAFTQEVGGGTTADQIVRTLLREAGRMLSAGSVRVWLPDPAGGPDVVYRLTENGEVEVGTEPAADDDVLRSVLAGTSVLAARGTTDPGLVRFLAGQGVGDAVIVPLRGGDSVLGALAAADRLGDLSTFGPDDVRLADTLAAHVAVALENGRLYERSLYAATHDPLTGLPNRGLFQQWLQEAVEAGPDAPLAVLLIDLDRFREFNEVVGHTRGDAVLGRVADRLQHRLPAGAVVARLGGDEFGVLLPGVRTVKEAVAAARQLHAALLDPLDVPGVGPLEVAGSVGVVLHPAHGGDAVTLLQRADVAMYAAKASPAAVQSWQPALDTGDPRRLALVGELRRAIERDELTVLYQPKVALPGGHLVGVEALVRWRHPVHGLLGADEFIPLAERTGLVLPLTDAVLAAALRQCRAWLDAGRRMGVAVNLSARGLLDPHLADRVEKLLTDGRVPPELLTLEITESSVMADVGRSLPVLQRLARAGLTLSVDDFGTGYSSLAYLRRLPVHEVKIDKSFVLSMGTDLGDAAIVETIVGLAHHLGLRVVAEGVEDEGSRDQLVAMGCDVVQGYLLSRPLDVERLEAWIAARDVGRAAGTDLREAVRLVWPAR
jgi:diguanylate cyclase (GGDEF)-like protein